MRVRLYYLAAAVGFALSAAGTWLGSGPQWPNRVTFGFLAAIASLFTVLYVALGSEVLRRLMVASVIIAASTRGLGWWVTAEASVSFRLGAVGAMIPIVALMLIANSAARKGL